MFVVKTWWTFLIDFLLMVQISSETHQPLCYYGNCMERWHSLSIYNWVFPKIVGFPTKSSILIGYSIIFTIHFEVPLFLETPIYNWWLRWISDAFYRGSCCWKKPLQSNRWRPAQELLRFDSEKFGRSDMYRWAELSKPRPWFLDFGGWKTTHGFKYCLFLPRTPGKMIQFDFRIFFRWVETTNQPWFLDIGWVWPLPTIPVANKGL